MNKKILGIILTTTAFAGAPFFAMAGCSVSGIIDVNTCVISGGAWTADPVATDPCAGSTSVYPLPGCSTAGSTVTGAGTTGGGSTATAPVGGSTATGVGVTTSITNPITQNTFSGFVAKVTATAVEILMPFVVLAFIWSGFLFVKAQGNEKELEEAKKAIWWSIVGAFILMGAWGFATIIGDTVTSLTH